MNKPILYMLVGIPASGKSTWANENEGYDSNEKFTYWFSSDKIRSIYNLKDNNKVFNILHNRIFEALREGYNAIYDATNVSRKYRIFFLNELNQKKIDCEKICVLFLTPVHICKERNAARFECVPDYVYDRMLRNFQLPMKEEGWDEIRIETIQSCMPYEPAAWIKEFGCSKMEIFDGKWDMEQENEHHTLSLQEHQKRTFSYIYQKYTHLAMFNICIPLMTAASYHDIGKFWTKTKNEGDRNAHYYGHENWGAYEFLVLIYMMATDEGGVAAKIDMEDYQTALLINWHMCPYAWEKSPKAKEKDEKLLSMTFHYMLDILHEADKEAH